jgi:hypothetical protein
MRAGGTTNASSADTEMPEGLRRRMHRSKLARLHWEDAGMSDYIAYMMVEFVIWGGLGLVLGSVLLCVDRMRRSKN